MACTTELVKLSVSRPHGTAPHRTAPHSTPPQIHPDLSSSNMFNFICLSLDFCFSRLDIFSGRFRRETEKKGPENS